MTSRASAAIRPLTVVVAPDSFKGSMTSLEVARALATGWSRARPADTLLLAPLADGGEGTLVAIHAAGGWEWATARATDPLGRPIEARWLRSSDGTRAFVEMAAASGLSRLASDERDALRASAFGTGEIIRAVLDAGVRRIVLGIGGSATTDGGSGMLAALGARLVLEAGGSGRAGGGWGRAAGGSEPTGAGTTPGGHPGPAGGAALASIASVDLAGLDPRLAEVELHIASDVTNPLLGPTGAAATYGPQKGATPAQVAELDAALARWADALEAATGTRERETAGAGAAGGVGFGLLCLRGHFASLRLEPGVELVMDQADLDEKLARADLVVTGEGRIDEQTGFGKTALGVARRAAAAGLPCIAVGGGVEPAGIEALAAVGAVVVPVSEAPGSLEAAMAAGAAPIERCGERLARLVSIGAELA